MTCATGGRAGVRYVITKFSRMDGLPNFVTHGALRARESSAKMEFRSFFSVCFALNFHHNGSLSGYMRNEVS